MTFEQIQPRLDMLKANLEKLAQIPQAKTSHELFERLEEAHCLPAGSAARFAPIVGFRNRVVNLYDRIDERRVYEILTQHRHDLAEVLDLLLAAIES